MFDSFIFFCGIQVDFKFSYVFLFFINLQINIFRKIFRFNCLSNCWMTSTFRFIYRFLDQWFLCFLIFIQSSSYTISNNLHTNSVKHFENFMTRLRKLINRAFMSKKIFEQTERNFIISFQSLRVVTLVVWFSCWSLYQNFQ